MTKGFDQCYAVMRIDGFLGPSTKIEDVVTVKEIVWDIDTAKREVERLNAQVRNPRIQYFWQTTRAAPRRT